MVTCLPPIWQHFATLQNRCNSATLNSQAWGADEAIEVILDEMADGIFETNPPLMFRRFDSLQSNRSKKYSQRRQILAKRPSAGSTGSGRLELSHMAACRETLQNAQKQVRLEDWQLLLAIGVGYTYQEVAEHVGQSPQYLKPKVSRLRAHLMKIISGNEISNKLISIATIVPKTLSLQTGHKMMSKEKTLAEFQLFSLGTGGIGSWLTPETDDRVFQRLAGIETEPLTMVQLNQLLAFGHEAPVSDDFFRYYWRDVPAEHPYEVSKLPDFQEAWLKCSAIISLPHLKWGLYRIFTDGLLYFGNVRTAYRELRSMTRPELVAFFGKHRFNTGLIKARGPALPLEIIPRDDRYLISEMACKSYGDSPESSGELKDALLQALRDHIGKGGGTISIRRLLDGSTVPDRYANRQQEFLFSADDVLDEVVSSEAELNEKYERIAKRFVNARKAALTNTEYYLSMVNDLDVYVATSMRTRRDFRDMANDCEAIFADERLKGLNIRYFDPTLSAAAGHEDKGLIECLMVKCAKALVYCVGQRESYGKDAEAAMALSLGKPVIFYCNEEQRGRFYRDVHPLSRLIEFETGIAVGVMVTDSLSEVSELLHRIFENKMEYRLEHIKQGYLKLKETLTNSVVRLQTSDQMLSETFWNHYHNRDTALRGGSSSV